MHRVIWAALLLGGSACAPKPVVAPLAASGPVHARPSSTVAAPPRDGTDSERAPGSSHGSGGLPCQRKGRDVTRCDDDERLRDTEGTNAAVLARIIKALRTGWDIAEGPILYGGSSGGSVLFTSTFLPRYGDRYPGVFALGCGGEMPWAGRLEWDSARPELRGPTKLFYTYGDRDDFLADIQSSIVYFRRLGFPIDERVVPDAGHCQFDHLGRTVELWSSYVGEE